jgi:hypothetical protein
MLRCDVSEAKGPDRQQTYRAVWNMPESYSAFPIMRRPIIAGRFGSRPKLAR